MVFSEVIEVKKLDLDIFKGEHKKRKDLSYKYKFSVRTMKKDFAFFAKSENEREVWLESLLKIMEHNEMGKSKFNLKATSNAYMRSMDASTPLM